jgi:hypothetical protein
LDKLGKYKNNDNINGKDFDSNNGKKNNNVIKKIFNQCDKGKNIKIYLDKNINSNHNNPKIDISKIVYNDIDIKCRGIAKLKTKGMIEMAQVCIYVCLCI